MSQTLIEKIAQAYSEGSAGRQVHAGDFLTMRPKHVMTHDNTGAVIPKFMGIGASKIADPHQPVFCIDHDIQNTSEANLAKYEKIRRFAEERGIDFYPPGTGIGHQVIVEQGYVTPGSLVVASDSHSNLYGAVGALGTPVVRTDAASIWATGTFWWQVPEVAEVRLEGKLPPDASGKDVIVSLIGLYNQDDVLNMAVEFTGPGVSTLSMEERMTIANMTTEWGALTGVFPCDDITLDYLRSRARVLENPRLTEKMVDELARSAPAADADAHYAKTILLDLSQVTPHVAGPNEVKTITSIGEIEKKKIAIRKAYLLSCVNARLEDFADAARVIGGGKVKDGVDFYIAAASAEVEKEARAKGYWQTLVAAGARELPPGCGPCIGLGTGTLEKGEVGISATNRNFKGRMGSPESFVYLSSPEVVAASAVAGYIRGPRSVSATAYERRLTSHPRKKGETAEVSILDGFPERVAGRILFIPKDNMNTDGIYGKDYTYKDDLTPDEMGRVAFLNYDPRFQEIAREGDIVVGGRNFGSGSSREQAATALKHRGIRLLVAASFSQTYQRNAFNNGYPLIECPDLVDHLRTTLRERVDAGELTISPGLEVAVDFRRSTIALGDRTFTFAPLSEVPQRLIRSGGVENLIREKL
jgi:homoaconitate hydratase